MSDLISRQAAIDAVGNMLRRKFGIGGDLAEITLAGLPSAQPEIVRCKDCKHSEHWYRDKRRCFLWNEAGIDVFEDGFCNYAERREDG